jgi:hypothetical protein
MKTISICLIMTLLAIGLSASLIDFNDTGDLTNLFNPSSVYYYENTVDGGLGNSGCVNEVLGFGNDTWTRKAGMTVPGIGQSIVISAYFRNDDIGIGGLGISTSNVNSGNDSYWIKDVPAMGTYFHGGGGAFLNNNSEYMLFWNLVAGDLPLDSWLKIIYTITNRGSNLFDLQLEIWNSDSNGNLGSLFTQQNANDFVNESITESSIVYPYFAFTWYRFDKMDNFEVNDGDNEETLPVELSSFTAIATSDYFVNLHWVTQTETNLSGYYIYRNTQETIHNALRVSDIIAGTNSSQSTYYEFTDSEVETGDTYYYWLQSIDLDGTINYHGPISVVLSNPNDHNDTPVVPTSTRLLSVYPNPFNPVTTIPYQLTTPETVHLSIYNSKGQLVKSYTKKHDTGGTFSIRFDGKDSHNKALANGIYHCVMKAGLYSASTKMVLLK